MAHRHTSATRTHPGSHLEVVVLQRAQDLVCCCTQDVPWLWWDEEGLCCGSRSPFPTWCPHLVSDELLDEAEQDFVGGPGLLHGRPVGESTQCLLPRLPTAPQLFIR